MQNGLGHCHQGYVLHTQCKNSEKVQKYGSQHTKVSSRQKGLAIVQAEYKQQNHKNFDKL